MLCTKTTTLDAAVFELFPITVFGNRSLVIAITPIPFEIH